MYYIVQLNSRDLEALPQLDTLYLKKWQTDGFYSLYKAVKVAHDDWRVHWHKEGEWSQQFCPFTDESFLKLLRKNDYLVSEVPMYDTDEFNFD